MSLEPADESRAPELWTNSSQWLKVERLISIHSNVAKEMQLNLHDLSIDQNDEEWLESSNADMERISALIQEDLVKPTSSLADLMYKSVEIRDSRHGLQLNTSLWRLSWVTFIFLPLTFIVGFFGMVSNKCTPLPGSSSLQLQNVDTFSNDPSIKWYFIVAVPMMILVFLGWYFFKHSLARQRQTPYSRGIYDHLFHEMAIQYPSLWSRAGPRQTIKPEGFFDRIRWRLVIFWNRPERTTRMGTMNEDAEFDDLGSWARLKRMITRRWTLQLRRTNRFSVNESAISLEDADDSTELIGSAISKATDILALPVTEHAENLPGGMLSIHVPPELQIQQRRASSRQSSAERPTSQGSSKDGNNAVMVEEERPSWLQDLSRGIHFPNVGGSKEADRESRRPSHAGAAPAGDTFHDGQHGA